ncbi:MAG: hypothetical protein KAU83_04680 [Bacteroidales bacterium]|nr:hypothetical protein [Bacteroidales bacterium]
MTESFVKLKKDYQELPTKERVKIYVDLIQYRLAKMRSIEIPNDVLQ